MSVKMISRIIMKNLAADPEIGFLTKSISKPFGRATAMPTARELTGISLFCNSHEACSTHHCDGNLVSFHNQEI